MYPNPFCIALAIPHSVGYEPWVSLAYLKTMMMRVGLPLPPSPCLWSCLPSRLHLPPLRPRRLASCQRPTFSSEASSSRRWPRTPPGRAASKASKSRSQSRSRQGWSRGGPARAAGWSGIKTNSVIVCRYLFQRGHCWWVLLYVCSRWANFEFCWVWGNLWRPAEAGVAYEVRKIHDLKKTSLKI